MLCDFEWDCGWVSYLWVALLDLGGDCLACCGGLLVQHGTCCLLGVALGFLALLTCTR